MKQRIDIAPFLLQVEIATGKMSLSALQTAMVALCSADTDAGSAIRARISEEIVKSLADGRISAALRGELDGPAVAALEERLRPYKVTIDGVKYYYVIGCGYVQANIIKVKAGRIVSVGSNRVRPGPVHFADSILTVGDQKISMCPISTPTMREKDLDGYYMVTRLENRFISWYWNRGQYTHSKVVSGNTVSVRSNNHTSHTSRLHKHVTRHMTDSGDGEFIVAFEDCGPFQVRFVAGSDHEAKLPGRKPLGFRVTSPKLKISGDIYQFEIFGRFYGYRLVTGDEDSLEEL